MSLQSDNSAKKAEKKRKVVQIAMGGEGCAEFYILCDDGTLWSKKRYEKEWTEIRLDLPAA